MIDNDGVDIEKDPFDNSGQSVILLALIASDNPYDLLSSLETVIDVMVEIRLV